MISILVTWVWPDTLIIVLATILIAALVHLIVVTLIKRMTSRVNKVASAITTAAGAKPTRTVARMTALAQLLKSVWTIVLVVVVALTLMSTLGVPLSPILASAGIGGLLLAFGAQSLIKDYLSGIIMIIEDQYGVGDQINVGEVSGTVENITLRITKIRDVGGTIWYVRNGEIQRVGNISQGYSTGLIDVPVPYGSDVGVVTSILTQVVNEVSQDPAMADLLLAPPQLLGVDSVTHKALTMRILIKTPPNQHYSPARDIRERAMAALAAGVADPH